VNKLSKAGFCLAIAAMSYLTWVLLTKSIPVNLATWALWFTIDFITIASLVRAKKQYALMVAFTTGTAVILMIALSNFLTGKTAFAWTSAETVCVIAVIVALLAWRLFNTASAGVVATSLAMVVAGVPTWINAFSVPESQDVIFWSLGATACMFSYFGSPKGFVDRFMPMSGALSNGVIILLASRQFV
jgi:hypothetical protein